MRQQTASAEQVNDNRRSGGYVPAFLYLKRQGAEVLRVVGISSDHS
jgi:hypothetical protein